MVAEPVLNLCGNLSWNPFVVEQRFRDRACHRHKLRRDPSWRC